MANRFAQTGDGKAPTFFIPASYKGHQISKPTISPPKTAGPLSGNHVTSPTKRLESGQSIDSNSMLNPGTTGINTFSQINNNSNTNNKSANVNNAPRPGAKPGESQQSAYLLASPSGVLDLSLYNFVPAQNKNNTTTTKAANGKSGNGQMNGTNTNGLGEDNAETLDLVDGGEVSVVPKEKKRRRFRRPRRNSKLDKLIRLLEDKRVGDDDENAEELEDLQMPRLRKVLNIIFVTLGVCFLLAVIIVIMYTTIAT
ncbi:unnamed protein product [Echinostoma caproni]|uniref:Uncharacterized protein n=1 Tax=Echinostoma caproni TaxID=27848 RepID=A0A183AAS6_9TREM|nr:unnamed protein product [Echinostoma caproni]